MKNDEKKPAILGLKRCGLRIHASNIQFFFRQKAVYLNFSIVARPSNLVVLQAAPRFFGVVPLGSMGALMGGMDTAPRRRVQRSRGKHQADRCYIPTTCTPGTRFRACCIDDVF